MRVCDLIEYLESLDMMDSEVKLIHSPEDMEFHDISPGRNHPELGQVWLEIDNH